MLLPWPDPATLPVNENQIFRLIEVSKQIASGCENQTLPRLKRQGSAEVVVWEKLVSCLKDVVHEFEKANEFNATHKGLLVKLHDPVRRIVTQNVGPPEFNERVVLLLLESFLARFTKPTPIDYSAANPNFTDLGGAESRSFAGAVGFRSRYYANISGFMEPDFDYVTLNRIYDAAKDLIAISKKNPVDRTVAREHADRLCLWFGVLMRSHRMILPPATQRTGLNDVFGKLVAIADFYR